MTDELTRLLNSLDATCAARPTDDDVETRCLANASAAQVSDLLDGILQLARQDSVIDQLLSPVFRAIMQSSGFSPRRSPIVHAPSIHELYVKLEAKSVSRHLLLAMLARCGDRESLRTFAELMVTDPPQRPELVVEACVPLWRDTQLEFDELFPRLLDAIQHPATATVVLDLANFLSVSGHVRAHPAAQRREELLELFARLIERLEGFEDASIRQGVSDLQAARQVAESVGLAVALCYALSLIRERQAVGRFYRMLGLRHRRLRVEAAAALARLKEKAGTEALVELAAEPSVRLSVLAYASELGILDEIASEHRSPVARAEADLVARLAEPSVYGFPPGEVKLVDSRSLRWPGFDEPIECYLFQFTYGLPTGDLTNIGLAGPDVHTFAADLTALDLKDVYAAFAGWQAEHEEIQQFEIDAENFVQATEVQRFCRAIHDFGVEAIQPEFIGEFFGQRCLVASGSRRNEWGHALASLHEVQWFPRADPQRPIGADLAYSIYKGRKLLHSFNEGFES